MSCHLLTDSKILEKINRLVSRLYGCSSPTEIGDVLTTHLHGIIDHDSAIYCAANLKSFSSVYYAQSIGDAIWDHLSVVDSYIHQLPFIPHYIKNPGDRCARISDLDTTSAWRRCELFNEAMRPMGIEEQLGGDIPGNPRLLRGFMLNRDTRSFSTRDLQVFDLVREHITAASATVDQWERMERGHGAHDTHDLRNSTVILDAKGNVILWSPTTLSLLNDFVPVKSFSSRQLPTMISVWVQREVTAFNNSNLWASPRRSLLLKGASSQITLRLSSGHQGQGHIILIEESRCHRQTSEGLNRLTSRQKAVLEWMAEGKSNDQIALILHLSVHTVKNHVKSILSQLGVDNRTSAAAIWLQANPV